jgi:hypothetical protein
LTEREPLYESADWTIDTQGVDLKRVVDEVVKLAASLRHG